MLYLFSIMLTESAVHYSGSGQPRLCAQPCVSAQPCMHGKGVTACLAAWVLLLQDPPDTLTTHFLHTMVATDACTYHYACVPYVGHTWQAMVPLAPGISRSSSLKAVRGQLQITKPLGTNHEAHTHTVRKGVWGFNSAVFGPGAGQLLE
jgi:hypothetical protein